MNDIRSASASRIVTLVAFVLSGAVFAQSTPDDGRREPFLDAQAAAGSRGGNGADGIGSATAVLLAPPLAGWISLARDSAIERGVAPVPEEIRAALEGFVPAQILDRARWRVDEGLISMEQAVFRFGATPAVTLDHVVVFSSEAEAANAKLWAHEIVHVMQFHLWGVDEFARRYLEDRASVEDAAWDFRWQWMKATGRDPRP